MDPGPFGQLFKLLLGAHPDARRQGAAGAGEGAGQEARDSMLQGERRQEGDEELYRVFTDPLQMTRFFEEQMDDMLRNFGQGFFGGSLRSGPGGSQGELRGGLPAGRPGLGDEDRRSFMLREDGTLQTPDTLWLLAPGS